MEKVPEELMAVLNALRRSAQSSTNAITQIVYELQRAGLVDGEALERIAEVFGGRAKPSHPDVPSQ